MRVIRCPFCRDIISIINQTKTKFECGICYEENKMAIFDCNHKICVDCTIKMLKLDASNEIRYLNTLTEDEFKENYNNRIDILKVYTPITLSRKNKLLENSNRYNRAIGYSHLNGLAFNMKYRFPAGFVIYNIDGSISMDVKHIIDLKYSIDNIIMVNNKRKKRAFDLVIVDGVSTLKLLTNIH